MSDTGNPWQSPGTEVSPTQEASGAGVLTATMVRFLREASPWLRFLGILGFIGCGLMTLGGLIFAIVITVFSELAGGFGGVVGGAFLGVVYIVLGLLSFFPSKFVYGFGSKIRHYIQSNSDKDLEDALRNNKSLWKFYGILVIVYLAFIPLLLIGAAVVAAISAIW
jgi:hypothetical protein